MELPLAMARTTGVHGRWQNQARRTTSRKPAVLPSAASGGVAAAANQEATDQNGANPDHGQLFDVRAGEGQTARTSNGARRTRGGPCGRRRGRRRKGKNACRRLRRTPRNGRGRHAASRLVHSLGLHARRRTRDTRCHGQSGHCEPCTHHQSPYPHHDRLFLAGCTRVPLPARTRFCGL